MIGKVYVNGKFIGHVNEFAYEIEKNEEDILEFGSLKPIAQPQTLTFKMETQDPALINTLFGVPVVQDPFDQQLLDAIKADLDQAAIQPPQPETPKPVSWENLNEIAKKIKDAQEAAIPVNFVYHHMAGNQYKWDKWEDSALSVGGYIDENGTAYLNSTLVGGGEPQELNVLKKMLKQRVDCPGCDNEDWKDFDLKSVIIHLNDKHKWTREAIADWLDQLHAAGVIDTTVPNPNEDKA